MAVSNPSSIWTPEELWLDPPGMTESQLQAAMRPSCAAHRELRRRIYFRDDYTCHLCGYRPDSKFIPVDYDGRRSIGDLCVDHIFHRLRGGLTTSRNLRTLCWPCNFTRGNKHDHEFPKARRASVLHVCPIHDEVYTFGHNPVCPVQVTTIANCGEFVARAYWNWD